MPKYLVALAVAAMTAVAALVSAPALASGPLVKGSGPTVYYVEDGRRYVFPSAAVFASWYPAGADVATVNDSALGASRLAGNVTYRPGVRMVKLTTDPKTYAVDKGGVLRWVASEQAAVALYGTGWNRMIDDVSDAFFLNYKVGEPIYSAADYSPTIAGSEVKTFSDELARAVSSVAVSPSVTATPTKELPPSIGFGQGPTYTPTVDDDGRWHLDVTYTADQKTTMTGNTGPFPARSEVVAELTFTGENGAVANVSHAFTTGKGNLVLTLDDGGTLGVTNTDTYAAELSSLKMSVAYYDDVTADAFKVGDYMNSPIVGGFAISSSAVVSVEPGATVALPMRLSGSTCLKGGCTVVVGVSAASADGGVGITKSSAIRYYTVRADGGLENGRD